MSASALERYRDGTPKHPRGYPDLHEHVLALARARLLVVVDEPINKDTEMHPLVRWQYRGGIAEEHRKAFLFTQPTDSKGRRFDISVLVAGLAANREVYRIGFGKPLDEIGGTWVEAIANPVAPRVVTDAPCQEVVITGEELDKDGAALDGLPVPISTPGWDNAPYLSAGHYITKDPDTGIQNVGNYRGQLKAPRRLGMNPSVELRAGIYAHWLKCKARGEPLPCAVVVGCPPAISYASVQKMPENLDEIAVAGALAGSPINVVRAKTVDLLVPAEAEIVIEGLINTELLEPEAPFGESHGYVNLQEYNAFMEVTAITRRRHPILTSFISQVTPSESSVIRRVAMEPLYLHHLRSVLGIKSVQRVAMHEPLTSLYAVIAIQFARGAPESEIWRALHGASSLHRFAGKWIVAVDEDIAPDNADALFWAMSYRCQPQHDLAVVPHKDPGHGPRGPRDGGESAAVLINATLKGTYAPVALPTREFMENAKAIWERLGLPPLTPQPPWHGYDLGHWPPELARQADMAARSDYFELGQNLANERRGDVAMNTPVEKRMKLAVPDMISNSYFPAIAAIELGCFKDEGLDVSLEMIFPVDKCYAALRDGSVDFVGGSAHSALAAFPQWQGAKLLCAQGQGMYWFLVMHKDLDGKRGDVSVVKGKRIGAAPWVDIGLRRLLVEAGIDLARDQVNIAPVPGAVGTGVNFGVTAAKALEDRKIDGFWANGMGTEVAVRRGVGTVVLDVRRGDGPKPCFNYTMASIATTEALIQTSPDTAAAAVRAMVKTHAALKADVSCATTIGKKLFPPSEAELIAELIRRDLPYYDPTISRDFVAGMNQFSRDMGILKGDVPYENVVATQVSQYWK